MSLTQALSILALAHTRDDELAGFVVEGHPTLFACTQAEYIEAWKAARHAVGMQVETRQERIEREKFEAAMHG